MARQPRSGGRPSFDYALKAAAAGDSLAWSQLRSAQAAFGSKREAGFQQLNIRATLQVALGDTIAVENTSTNAGERPTLKLPKLKSGDTGKQVVVVCGANSAVAQYIVTATDQIISGATIMAPSSSNNMTLGSGGFLATAHIYYAVGPKYGWRLMTIS